MYYLSADPLISSRVLQTAGYSVCLAACKLSSVLKNSPVVRYAEGQASLSQLPQGPAACSGCYFYAVHVVYVL